MVHHPAVGATRRPLRSLLSVALVLAAAGLAGGCHLQQNAALRRHPTVDRAGIVDGLCMATVAAASGDFPDARGRFAGVHGDLHRLAFVSGAPDDPTASRLLEAHSAVLGQLQGPERRWPLVSDLTALRETLRTSSEEGRCE
ncbi:MAG: hypothetical protein ABIS47_14470 [Acidimicrobiales bacterium]